MPHTTNSIDFWYDFASPYAYLSAMRIEALAEPMGIAVRWQPFLLGPIFKAQGWNTSPFNLYPAKGRYMIRDVERVCAERGLVFHKPQMFPANSVLAARLALMGVADGWIGDFSKAVFMAQFSRGQDISDHAVLTNLCEALDLDFASIYDLSGREDNRAALRRQTERAQSLGMFGAPTFCTPDGEMFWGDDRLRSALTWCKKI